MAVRAPLTAAESALATGQWDEARAAYEIALTGAETPEAHYGLANAQWWLGQNRESVASCTRAYALFRAEGNLPGAVQCAVWLCITYKANFANFSAANGWVARAERMLEGLDRSALHGWVALARAYRMPDLDSAARLTDEALAIALAEHDVDLELTALSQSGLIKVGQGSVVDGLTLVDEAMAAALAGESTSLDTVAYASCDMLNACELASDLERASHWCRVADDFVARYGCPFLYAECRIYYGSVLAARGQWHDAERQLEAGLDITAGACPGLHARACTRLADLRIRQGRLEEAAQLLSELDAAVEAEGDVDVSIAALSLARGDAAGASHHLEQRMQHLGDHRRAQVAALDLLVDAALAVADLAAAQAAAARLDAFVDPSADERTAMVAIGARGRVALAAGDRESARRDLDAALACWLRLELPYEIARTRLELSRVDAATSPEVAIDRARRALSTFEELGAIRAADECAAQLRALGVVPRIGAKGVGQLTARERAVLELLGHGLSNPEIAARLHVSRKTASHHVSNILAKLDLRNRAEAAAYATRYQR